uniref:Replication protein A 70 kDa DNA-binding subunit B/D first OB fold domain-containing protein n=1 Tax=Lactuca sativa TaxID=4236 RepID=A0A9R1V2R1_LACSA|nr:hypothetical protein LSAT_V11C600319000 [Lactuca sativa]
MTANNAYQIVFDKVAEINASKECWNIRVKVVMLWKPTYTNNPNVVANLEMILIDHEGCRIQAIIKKNLIPVFESLFDEGAVREISNFAIANNEGEYMLVPHKHKINFYKTTKVRVSIDFVDTVDRYHFISFPDLLARNFDAYFLGEVVSTDPMRVIVEYGREKRLMNLVAQDLRSSSSCLNSLDTNVESSSRTSQLNSDTVVANPEDYYLRSQIKNIDEIPDLMRIRIVVCVQDESGSSSFVLFERHVKYLIHRGNQWLMEKIAKDQGRQQIPDEFKILLNKKFVFKVQISMFNLQNNYRAYTVHKLTDDERVLAEENTNSVHDNNLDVVDLEAVTPSSSTRKRPIEIDANTDSLEWSSSRTRAVRDTLKIPKLEKLD